MKKYIFGIKSYELSQKEIDLFKKIDLFGIALFTRNIESKDQVMKLNKDIKNKLGEGVKICVDQEGGRVQRINFTKKYLSSFEFAQKYKEGGDIWGKSVKKNIIAMSYELKDLGFDINFAPVCDILYPVETNLISDRSFGENQEIVTRFCRKFIQYSKKLGIDCVLKHIPGHGRADIDSHINLPIVKSSLEELNNSDFMVFKNLSKDCNLAMTAHVIYESLDSEKPFTISKKAIKYIKDNIFNGLLLTDAIEMGAMIKYFDKNVSCGYEGVNFYEKKIYETTDERCKILYKISKECFDAGIDVVMHCSGDLKEMQAIINGF